MIGMVRRVAQVFVPGRGVDRCIFHRRQLALGLRAKDFGEVVRLKPTYFGRDYCVFGGGALGKSSPGSILAARGLTRSGVSVPEAGSVVLGDGWHPLVHKYRTAARLTPTLSHVTNRKSDLNESGRFLAHLSKCITLSLADSPARHKSSSSQQSEIAGQTRRF